MFRGRGSARRRSTGALALAGGLLAGCGAVPADGAAGLDVLGPPGRKPQVAQPPGSPPALPEIKVLKEGTGPEVERGDVVVTNVDIRVWQGLKPYLNTWDTRQPTTVAFDGAHVGRTWEETLMGRRAGSRVLLVSPARLGLGPQGIAPASVRPTDTLIEVFDILGGYRPGAQVSGARQHTVPGLPAVTVPEGAEPRIERAPGPQPRALTVRTLVEGEGAPIRPGSSFVMNYAGFLWNQGRAFDSSYRRGGPNGFVLENGAVPPGWAEALDGVRAGSRVMVAVPTEMGRGFKATKGGVVAPSGRPLVYVMDILDTR